MNLHLHNFRCHLIPCSSNLSLKGHCHAIWQLYKKLEGAFAAIEFQNLWSSFGIEDYFIWSHWNCFLSPVATDGIDGKGLKHEIFFRGLMLRVPEFLKKFIMVSPLWWNSFDIFVVALLKHFVYDYSLKVMILADNWPKTAKSSWHCSFKGCRTLADFLSLSFRVFVGVKSG